MSENVFELDFPLGGTITLELSQFELGHLAYRIREMELSESKLDQEAAQQLADKIEAALKSPRSDNTLERVAELREFARDIVELAHEGDLEPCQVYEIGTRRGIIKVEEMTVPCVPHDEQCGLCCKCAEGADDGEVVDCYRLNPELFPVPQEGEQR